jgi:release factor glutamine methyltransferase
MEQALAISIFQADVCSENWINSTGEKYGIIVSNPPYICRSESESMHKNVLAFEPEIALFVDDEDPLLFYRNIAHFARRNLTENGSLWFELNRFKAKETEALLREMGFAEVVIYNDLSGAARFISAIINQS